jgi:hypothetical protein
MVETPRIRKVERGPRRWKELPQPADVRHTIAQSSVKVRTLPTC